MSNNISKARIAELLAAARAKKASIEAAPTPTALSEPKNLKASSLSLAAIKAKLGVTTASAPIKKEVQEQKAKSEPEDEANRSSHTGIDGKLIYYNAQQQKFVDLIASGKSCVLIGAAGTGKTTGTQGGAQALIKSGAIPIIQSDNHKHIKSGGPGILIISYTRRAVNNIRKVQADDLKANCITAHKLLEYAPEFFTITDPITGIDKKSMQFLPTRNALNPLPPTIHTIIVEEASMLDVGLYNQLLDALAHPVQWVFIGDINQLPPVFGSAVLGFKMLTLPLIELTEVYRQAMESPIIRLAHRILSGNPIPVSEYPEWKQDDKNGVLTIHPWKKKLTPELATRTLAAFFEAAISSGSYKPDEDMILIPYNKSCGTIELNKHIANFLAVQRGETVWEVRAGFNLHYFSIGDKVLYDREDAQIVDIVHNPTYSGAPCQAESKTLDYWGYNATPDADFLSSDKLAAKRNEADAVDMLLAQVESGSKEDRVTVASHRLIVRLLDSGQEITVDSASDINSLLHAYALTVHKSQGSEWRKVFLCFHQSHATMLQRELLYTAVTRAKEELYIICEPETFTKGIRSQRIKGNTIKEKAEVFMGKIVNGDKPDDC